MYKTFLKAVDKRKKAPEILKHVYVKGGLATTTDLEIMVQQCLLLDDGFYDPKCLIKDVLFKNDEIDFDGDYPFIDFKDHKDPRLSMSLNKKAIEGIKWVALAQSTETTRYYLNGIYTDGKRFVATDGHRLHMVEGGFDLELHKKKFSGEIIPRAFWDAVFTAVSDIKHFENFLVRIYESHVVASVFGLTITAKLIDGTYPDYARVFPKKKKRVKIPFDPDCFKSLMPRLKVLAKTKLSGSTISLAYNGQHWFIDVDGLRDTTFDADFRPCLTGFGANAKYLSEMCGGLAYMDKESLSDPVIVECKRGEYKKTGVIMPTRTSYFK